MWMVPAVVIWAAVLLLPWRPWSTRERLDSNHRQGPGDLHDVTVLIPARNEAKYLGDTLRALGDQGVGLQVMVVDDESVDATSEVAASSYAQGLTIIAGSEPPEGWSGKLWALEQGRNCVTTPYVLLLDADVVLAPGMIAALLGKMRENGLDLVSVMVELRWKSVAERFLLPAFVYFFRFLYPFELANNYRFRRIAAAAGGCMLVRNDALHRIGGFKAIRGHLIDDCELARRLKGAGSHLWVGLTHSACSRRAYGGLREIRDLIARCAFIQLHYSLAGLLGLTFVFVLAFWAPLIGVLSGRADAGALGLAVWFLMMLSYGPTLRYYELSLWWSATLPLIATFYLLSSWYSAVQHWRGQGSKWKGRTYVVSDSR